KLVFLFRFSEYERGDSSSERRNEGWNSFQDNFDKRSPLYEDNGYETQPSHRRDNNGSMVMRDVLEDPKGRYCPYSFQGNRRRVRWHREGNIHVTVWGNEKPVMREVRENTQDGTQGSWFKVTIPHGIKYDKIWLMNSIQSLCSVCFTPVDFHYVKNGARFFVQKASTASALMDVSNKICDEENQKIPIFVNPSAVPYSVRNKLGPEKMERLKLAFNKRFDVSQQSLDLQKLRFDPNLVGHDIEIILNRRNCMAAALQVIKKNFPELLSLNLSCNKLYQLDGLSDIVHMVPTIKILNLSKNELHSLWELNKVKGLKLEELWLRGNPLCDSFPDQSTYVRSVVVSSAYLRLLCPLPVRNFLPLTCLPLQVSEVCFWFSAPSILHQGLPRAWFGNQGSSPSPRPRVTRLDLSAGPWTEKGPPGPGLMLRRAFLLHAETGLPSSILPLPPKGFPSSSKLTQGLSCPVPGAEVLGGCSHDIRSPGPKPGAGSFLGKSRVP
uniref:Nuclear RNA export factor Tap RNA-binding domain-containing protein n=1 Tax=Moschus moschiferus TaxID=68415 RepID=A0A8C6FN43_MOSMO